MTKLVFDGQREGEEVKFIFRRHLTTAKAGFVFLLLMIFIGVIPLYLWQGDLRMFWLFGIRNNWGDRFFIRLYVVVLFDLYCDRPED